MTPIAVIVLVSFVVVMFTIIHNSKLKSFTSFLSVCLFNTLSMVYILIGKVSVYVKIASLILFICIKPLQTSFLILFLIINMFVFKNYFSFRTIGNLLFGRQIMSFPTSPTIFIANYPADILEYMIIGIFPTNTSWLVHSNMAKILIPIFGKKRIISVNVRDKNSFAKIAKDVQKRLAIGYHVFAYPEKSYYTRRGFYDLNPLRSGLFHIAKMLGVTITPVVCDHLHYSSGFVDPIRHKIEVLQSIVVTNVNQTINQCEKIMRKKLHYLKYRH